MSRRMIPKSRPGWDLSRVLVELMANGVDTHGPALLGVRGYYRDTMGKPGVNDRGIYDDAMFVYAPSRQDGEALMRSFNANTDPSRHYKHKVATLLPGVHPYRLGWHKKGQPTGHKALRPATHGEELPVRRDGVKDPWPGVAINIHRGGRTTTSSEGCQTLPPDQWPEFYALIERVMKECGVKIIPYVLIEAQG